VRFLGLARPPHFYDAWLYTHHIPAAPWIDETKTKTKTKSGPCLSPCTGAYGARCCSCVQQPLYWPFLRPCWQWPVLAVARTGLWLVVRGAGGGGRIGVVVKTIWIALCINGICEQWWRASEGMGRAGREE
jgi:hypothetical protein